MVRVGNLSVRGKPWPFGFACETKGKRKAGEALGLIPVLGSLAMAIGYTVVMGWSILQIKVQKTKMRMCMR